MLRLEIGVGEQTNAGGRSRMGENAGEESRFVGVEEVTREMCRSQSRMSCRYF